MNALLQLAERCEKATGPDRELDMKIIMAVHPGAKPHPSTRLGRELFVLGDGHFRLSDFRYTASLDAAMTLVAPDWFFHVSRFSPECDGRGDAHVYPNRCLGDDYESDAVTPALALCAAALKARAASVGRNGNRQDRETGLGPKGEHAVANGETPKA